MTLVVTKAVVTTTPTSMYTVPANTKAQIIKVLGYNANAAERTLSVIYNIDGTGAITYVNKPIDGTSSDLLPEVMGQVLDAADIMAVSASATSSVVVIASIKEYPA